MFRQPSSTRMVAANVTHAVHVPDRSWAGMFAMWCALASSDGGMVPRVAMGCSIGLVAGRFHGPTPVPHAAMVHACRASGRALPRGAAVAGERQADQAEREL